MLAALAYLTVFVIRIPLPFFPEFLKYEPKDVIILIAAFIFGPLSGILMSVVVSFVELVTISSTGWIGFVMNVLSTVAFILPPAILYRKNKTVKNAAVGLVIGALSTTAVMFLWNYFLTPIYMNLPLEKVLPILYNAVIPFNLLKSLINAILTFVIYKPLVQTLRKAHLIES